MTLKPTDKKLWRKLKDSELWFLVRAPIGNDPDAALSLSWAKEELQRRAKKAGYRIVGF